ncbi:hypothetical protein CPB83DRAFT_905852 [Crepidotus variabilis]|uniref:Uncharacterized protein n=1 Tax=Crepidotus variabilis TaxID=179855 RepID=A0A9P6EIX8_9AGAR|nr:hypothetical protein CPB83DRAFT_905852 [Crepidotus variabilis]
MGRFFQTMAQSKIYDLAKLESFPGLLAALEAFFTLQADGDDSKASRCPVLKTYLRAKQRLQTFDRHTAFLPESVSLLNMQFITAIVAVAALVSHTNAMAVRSDACADVCQTIKPECSADTTARGFEGCWGCCEPLTTISPSDNQRYYSDVFTMRFFISAVAILSALALNVSAGVVCTAVCRPEKPVCPAGQAPGGSEGCWGCCAPIYSPGPIVSKPVVSPTPAIDTRQDSGGDGVVCTKECKLVKPVCPYNQKASGFEGCWGCCVPI